MCQKNEAPKNINLGKFSVVYFMNVMCSNYSNGLFEKINDIIVNSMSQLETPQIDYKSKKVF